MKWKLSQENRKVSFEDQAGDRVRQQLGSVPNRWGRMNPLSRALLLESCAFLQDQELWKPGERFSDRSLSVGLIGGSRYGSLQTDIAFQATLDDGLASPALFGYTLPNIPLAEVANHFGLTGPVYGLLDCESPFEAAVEEAKHLLKADPELSCMLACHFDHYPAGPEGLAITLTIVKSNV